jgi:hypothetical protein
MRGVLSMGSGLEVLGANILSNILASDDVAAGPVKGPTGKLGSPSGRFPAPTRCALASKSNMFCVSTSPAALAWALAIPALEETDQAMRSRMNSIERFRTFWRLCIRSSDWWANEKEWSDSDGKRERSSVKVGELGPGESGTGRSRSTVAEEDLVMVERDGVRLMDAGMVGARIGLCCWRMRLSPDMPKPWSWSVMRELLGRRARQRLP